LLFNALAVNRIECSLKRKAEEKEEDYKFDSGDTINVVLSHEHMLVAMHIK